MKKAICLIVLAGLAASVNAQDNTLPRDFDFLDNKFDCTYRGFDPDGTVISEFRCVWSGRYTFDGRMFQDDFIMFDKDGVEVFSGTTLRTWSHQLSRWEMVFLGSSQPATWAPFHGVPVADGISITNSGEDAEGPFIGKIRFFDISDQGFVWDLHRSHDDGQSWVKTGEIVSSKQAGS